MKMSEKKNIGSGDFLRMFGVKAEDLPVEFSSRLERINTWHRNANADELSEYILHLLKLINKPFIKRNEEENLEAFETGWRENLDAATSGEISSESLKPGYFRGSKFFRYDKGLVVVENLDLEYDLFRLARLLIFNRYLSSVENIYEIGCGSCQNLLMLSEMYPDKMLYGMDWTTASVKIAELLARSQGRNIEGIRFDMTDPLPDVAIKPNSAVITIHSMEQLGAKHGKLLAYLLDANPRVVVHYEPILEFYDENNLLDYLAVLYSRKRDYLSGFWAALCELREQRKIQILESRRPFLGGIIHEASLIAWKPV